MPLRTLEAVEVMLYALKNAESDQIDTLYAGAGAVRGVSLCGYAGCSTEALYSNFVLVRQARHDPSFLAWAWSVSVCDRVRYYGRG